MSLTFLSPLMLAGAALVAVPIILHLVMRQQPKHLVFPAVRFIRQRQEANRRQLRLRHWLLLLLRCAAICLLAAALARPTLRAAGVLGDEEAPVAAALLFETSPRMQYRHQNQTRLEAAQETAAWLLSQLPRESDVAVLDSANQSAVFSVDVSAAKQRVERLATTATPQPLTDVLDQALRLLAESEQVRQEIYVFSDLARSGWGERFPEQLQSKLQEADNLGLYIIDVGLTDPSDFALGDVRLSSQTLARNSPLRVETDLSRTGLEEERAVALYLLDKNGQPEKRSQQNYMFKPGESQPAEFEIGGLDVGTHQGYLQIVGEDSLPADDLRYFTVDVRPAWRVLVAAPKPAERYADFLTQALAPALFRKSGQARFECEVISLDQIVEKQLDDYAAVCLLDPTPLDEATWRALAQYVEVGGGLAIWLGRNALPLEKFNQPAATELLPGRLLRRWRAGADDLFLAKPDFQHPAMSEFRPLEGSIPWDAFPIFEHWQIEIGGQDINTLLSYSNGQPALLERNVGKGHVMTMTTPISDAAIDREAWNLLPSGFDEPWPFVMLSNEILLYLVGSGDERLNYFSGDAAVLRLSEDQTQAVFSLTTPLGDQIPQSADQQLRTVTVTSTETVGNYRLRAGGEEGGVDRGFSVNIPSRITQLERLDKGELDEWFGEAGYRLARNRQEIDRDVNMGRVGRELYGYLIFLVALALGLEYLLANRFYRRDARTEGVDRTKKTTALSDDVERVVEEAVA